MKTWDKEECQNERDWAPLQSKKNHCIGLCQFCDLCFTAFLASYFFMFVLGLDVLMYAAFYVAGIACCVGIIRNVRWSFLAGVLMWTVEGIVFISAAYVNTEVIIGPNGIHYTNPIYVFPFIVVALCRLVSAAYLAREEMLKRKEVQ